MKTNVVSLTTPAAEQWRVDTEEGKAYIGPLGDTVFCHAIAE
jgi:hypothetical protein